MAREEAEQIKTQLAKFLRDHLKLELSKEKTLITQARTEAARFLGFEIVSQDADDKHCRRRPFGRMASAMTKPVPTPF
jgi:hypothetical protein